MILKFIENVSTITNIKKNSATNIKEYYPCRTELKVVDVLQTGQLSNILREINSKEYNEVYGPLESFIIKKSLHMPFEYYKTAVYYTFQRIENKAYDNPEAVNKVLHYIYTAFSKHQDTNALIQFTAHGLHNMYGFDKFIRHKDGKDENISRGLIQWTGPEAYKQLKPFGIRKGFYSVLDKFDERSIAIEVDAFMKYYYVSTKLAAEDHHLGKEAVGAEGFSYWDTFKKLRTEDSLIKGRLPPNGDRSDPETARKYELRDRTNRRSEYFFTLWRVYDKMMKSHKEYEQFKSEIY